MVGVFEPAGEVVVEFFVEGHFAHGAVASLHGVAGSVFEGAEDTHLEVI